MTSFGGLLRYIIRSSVSQVPGKSLLRHGLKFMYQLAGRIFSDLFTVLKPTQVSWQNSAKALEE